MNKLTTLAKFQRSSKCRMVEIHRDRVANVSASNFPGNHTAEDGEFDLSKFQQGFDISVSHISPQSATFDLKGLDASFANAYRRIMLAEIPNVAIEHVFVHMNTSVIQDEVLAQRLGLVPLQLNPDWLSWVDSLGENENTSENTVVFKLEARCERNPNATGPDDELINGNVYARDLKFEPQGEQLNYMNPPPSVAHPDILLAKLRPGQEINVTCWAVLGLGSDHAKWSPVATASYRMMPTIDIVGDIPAEDAKRFQSCFAPGVIEIGEDGRPIVADPRRDTVSREVLRHPEFADKVKLGRNRDHFIFNVESAGTMEPDETFVKSIAILRNKAKDLLAIDL